MKYDGVKSAKRTKMGNAKLCVGVLTERIRNQKGVLEEWFRIVSGRMPKGVSNDLELRRGKKCKSVKKYWCGGEFVM